MITSIYGVLVSQAVVTQDGFYGIYVNLGKRGVNMISMLQCIHPCKATQPLVCAHVRTSVCGCIYVCIYAVCVHVCMCLHTHNITMCIGIHIFLLLCHMCVYTYITCACLNA